MKTPMRVLLIDDDEVDRHAISRVLRQNLVTCEIVQAATAAGGLQLAAEQHFDAVLLDYRLPDRDGLEVLRLLREEHIDGVAVVMLSRQEDETIAERCLDAGAQDFLLKDEVNGRRLSRAVRQAMHRYSMEDALRSSREQLRELSERDPLTGLTNRRGFELALEAAIARASRGDDHLAVLLLDLDDFKSVNDTLGHDAGDILLKEIARRLDSVVRKGDILCRLGGDEFVVLMTNFEEYNQAALLADRIIAMLQEPISIGVTEQTITTSIGIAILDSGAKTAIDLLKFADVAMYQAKQGGRNQSRFYSAQLQEAMLFRAEMKQDMRRALAKSEFKIYYQAQVSSADGSLGGMEALLRWHHPRLGVLSPATFMPIAEETGLIVNIGNWVLGESCRQLAEWNLQHPLQCRNLTIAVNFSAQQIKQNAFSDIVKNTLAEHQLGGSSLELEITESALIEDASKTAAVLTLLTEQGVSLSLDDFGTGYSSLERLRLFPIGVLKIDRGFVSTIGAGRKYEQLLVAIIAFAKALEMKVVAEGVETKEQADFCKEHGCDLLQGYYYSRPIPAEDFESVFIRTERSKITHGTSSRAA